MDSGWVDGWMDGQVDRRGGGWMDEWMGAVNEHSILTSGALSSHMHGKPWDRFPALVRKENRMNMVY